MSNREPLDRTCAVTTVVLGLAMTAATLYAIVWLGQYELSQMSSHLDNQPAAPGFWDAAGVLAGMRLWEFPLLVLVILSMFSVIVAVGCLVIVSSVVTPICTAIARQLSIRRNRRAHHAAIQVRRTARLHYARTEPNA